MVSISNICAGDILVINTKGVNGIGVHRGTKYVVVASNNQKWMFCINTLNRNYQNTIPIRKIKHHFLKNEEHYISCNSFFEFETSHILQKYGSLDKTELTDLCIKITTTKTISPLSRQIIIEEINMQILKFSSE